MALVLVNFLRLCARESGESGESGRSDGLEQQAWKNHPSKLLSSLPTATASTKTRAVTVSPACGPTLENVMRRGSFSRCLDGSAAMETSRDTFRSDFQCRRRETFQQRDQRPLHLDLAREQVARACLTLACTLPGSVGIVANFEPVWRMGPETSTRLDPRRLQKKPVKPLQSPRTPSRSIHNSHLYGIWKWLKGIPARYILRTYFRVLETPPPPGSLF